MAASLYLEIDAETARARRQDENVRLAALGVEFLEQRWGQK